MAIKNIKFNWAEQESQSLSAKKAKTTLLAINKGKCEKNYLLLSVYS